MNDEISITKGGIKISLVDTVTISRYEYNDLVAAKVQRDMILATSDASGYGCSEIVKGARSLDKYSKAVSNAEELYDDLLKKHTDIVNRLEKENTDLKAQLIVARTHEMSEPGPEAVPHA